MKVHVEKKPYSSGRSGLRLWYIDARGERQRVPTGLILEPGSTPAIKRRNKELWDLAERMAFQLQLELLNGGGEIAPHDGGRIDVLEYFKEVAARKKNVTWVTGIKHLTRYMGKASLELRRVTPQWINGYKDFLLGELGLSNNSAEKYLANLNTALKQALRERRIPRNPFEESDRLRAQEVQRAFLTIPEMQRLADAPCPNPEVKRAFLFSCATALRYSDVSNLRWQDIQGDRMSFRQRKTKVVMHLPLNKTALLLLGERGPDDALVFSLPTQNYVNKAIARWAKAAGLAKHISYHTSRHTYACTMVELGADILFIQKYLGHECMKTSLIYAKMAAERLRAINDMFPALSLTNVLQMSDRE